MGSGRSAVFRLAALLLVMFVLGAAVFPAAAMAEGGPQEELEHDGQYYHFDSLETLKRILEVESEEGVWATEVKDLEYTLCEDLTVPAGKKVFFGTGTVTVEQGVTVTVEEGAALFFYAMDLYGTVVNRGDLVQCRPNDGEDYLLRIHGRIINSDWFYYEHAEGIENVENLEGDTAYTDRDETPEPEPVPEPTPEPKSSAGYRPALEDQLRRFLRRLGWSAERFYRLNQDEIRKAIPWAVLAVASLILASGGKKKRRNADSGVPGRRGAGSASQAASTYAGRADLTDDQKKRIRHLDEWLQSGLIDRAEYKVLRERYERQQR